MTQTFSIQQASANLGELIHSLGPDDEIVLTDNNQPVARIVPSAMPKTRTPGAWKGKLEIVDVGDAAIVEHYHNFLQ